MAIRLAQQFVRQSVPQRTQGTGSAKGAGSANGAGSARGAGSAQGAGSSRQTVKVQTKTPKFNQVTAPKCTNEAGNRNNLGSSMRGFISEYGNIDWSSMSTTDRENLKLELESKVLSFQMQMVRVEEEVEEKGKAISDMMDENSKRISELEADLADCKPQIDENGVDISPETTLRIELNMLKQDNERLQKEWDSLYAQKSELQSLFEQCKNILSGA